jgi:hypothetical protein
LTAPLPAVAGADADAGQRRQWRGAPGGLTGQPLQRPAPSWRAVGLAALLGLGAAAAVLPVVAARTGGWLVRNDGVAYFLYARALVLEGSTDPTDGCRRIEARSGPGARDPMGPLAALHESLRRVPGTGRVALPWPVGAGVLMAPFYAAGWGAERLAASRQGRAPDSFGFLPQYFYGLGAAAYGLLGCWASFRAAARVAPAGAAAASVLALVLAGPAVFYVFLHPAMSHAPSLGLAALLVLLWWRLWDAGRAGTAELAGLAALLGLLVLVRYQNVVFAVLPAALWARLAGRGQWRSARAAATAAVAAALAGAAPLALEVSHLAQTGELRWTRPVAWAEGLVGGAGRRAAAGAGAAGASGAAAGETAGRAAAAAGGAAGGGGAAPDGRDVTLAQNRFDFTSPHFADVLLSCQHGAFYWTPVLGLGTAALAWQALRRGWARALGAVLLAGVYLVGCLTGRTNWSGDNAYGMRYLTESVPLLAPALAVWIGAATRPAARSAWALGLALLVAANGLLMLAFARRTISHQFCVTWSQMAAGVVRALPGTGPEVWP